MDFKVMEVTEFDQIKCMFETIQKTVVDLATENEQLKGEKWLSMKEAMAYTGFGLEWLNKRKEAIGYFQDGKDIKFKKKAIDAYMDKNTIKRKS